MKEILYIKVRLKNTLLLASLSVKKKLVEYDQANAVRQSVYTQKSTESNQKPLVTERPLHTAHTTGAVTLALATRRIRMIGRVRISLGAGGTDACRPDALGSGARRTCRAMSRALLRSSLQKGLHFDFERSFQFLQVEFPATLLIDHYFVLHGCNRYTSNLHVSAWAMSRGTHVRWLHPRDYRLQA